MTPLRAVLTDAWAQPDPERKRPGAGSIVTIFDVRWVGEMHSALYDCIVGFYDQWGQIGRGLAEDVTVLGPIQTTLQPISSGGGLGSKFDG